MRRLVCGLITWDYCLLLWINGLVWLLVFLLSFVCYFGCCDSAVCTVVGLLFYEFVGCMFVFDASLIVLLWWFWFGIGQCAVRIVLCLF